MSAVSPTLTFNGVSRRFPGGVVALNEVSFSVGAGEVAAVVGPSGCGKTTLMRIAAGLDCASGGSVSCVLPSGAVAAEGATVRTSCCFQDPRLLPWRRVIDNVALPLELAGVDRVQRRARAMEVLRAAGLEGAMERLPSQLSGGMRMRVGLARALVTSPQLLLLDEPCSSVDEFTRLQLDEEIRRVCLVTSATTLLITHSVQEAVWLATKVVIMGHGRVLETRSINLPPQSRDRMCSAFLGEVESILRVLSTHGVPAEYRGGK